MCHFPPSTVQPPTRNGCNHMRRYLPVPAALLCLPFIAAAQSLTKSHSSGFFLGVGFENLSISTEQSSGKTLSQDGTGGGLVVGYGFTPRWSIYSQISSGVIHAGNNNSYGLAH